MDFNNQEKRDQSLHLKPFTEPTPHGFEETLPDFSKSKILRSQMFLNALQDYIKDFEEQHIPNNCCSVED